MSVDVMYQGLTIARDAPMRVEGDHLFIETEAPMPVATQVRLLYQDQQVEARVQRVHEGVGAGMALVPTGGALPAWVGQVQPHKVETVEFEAEPEAPRAEPVQAAPAEAAPAPTEAAPAEAAHAEAPAEPEAPAAASTATPPVPYEATQEMAIPALDDETGADVPKDSGRGKKKKPARRR